MSLAGRFVVVILVAVIFALLARIVHDARLLQACPVVL